MWTCKQRTIYYKVKVSRGVQERRGGRKRKSSGQKKLQCLRVQDKQSGIKGAVTLSCVCVCTSRSLGVAISLFRGNAGRRELCSTTKRRETRGRRGCKNGKWQMSSWGVDSKGLYSFLSCLRRHKDMVLSKTGVIDSFLHTMWAAEVHFKKPTMMKDENKTNNLQKGSVYSWPFYFFRARIVKNNV